MNYMSNLKFYKPPVWLNLTVAVLTVTSLIGSVPFKADAVVVPTPSWPPSWTTPAQCSEDPSDESPASIDLIGLSGNAAVGFAEDSSFFYFREKVDGDPINGANWAQQSWFVHMQVTPPAYQYIFTLNGKDELVQIWSNNTPGLPVDYNPVFNDPAENLLWSGSIATYGGTSSAGGGDYFVYWAIPKLELTNLGITSINSSTTKYFGTSTSSVNSNNYNKDFLNCYEQIADLSVVKTDNADPVSVGDTLTYTIIVTNGGPDTSADVVVNDVLPANLTYSGSYTATQGTYSGGVWTVGTLTYPTSNSASLTINATVGAGASGTTLSNTATASATTLDNVPGNNSDTELTGVNALPVNGTLSVVKVVNNNNGGTL